MSNNKRVRFAKIISISETQFYEGDVGDCLERRGKPPITNRTKIKQKLQEKYLPYFYRNKLLDQ